MASLGNRTFAALRTRNYRLFISGQAVSMSGTWMQSVAQSWLVLKLTGSGTALGLVVAAQFVPTLLGGPWGGLVADRFDSRRLLLGTQTVAGLLALVLGVLTVTDRVELWMVYVLAAGLGMVTAIDNPTRQTFVMAMVGPADVANAVTLNSVVVNAARIVGPGLAGVVISTLGVGPCFLLNAVSFLAVILVLALMRPSELHHSERAPRARGQLREGFRYVRSTPGLRVPLIMMAVIGTLAYEFTVTLPLLSEFTFDAGSGGFAAMSALMGAGAVLGGLVTASLGPPTPRRLCIMAAAFGILISAAAVSPNLVIALAVMPVLGAASVSVIAQSNATLQLAAAPQLRGRVMALFSVAFLGSTPIGGPIVGFVAEHGNPRLALGLGAAASVLAAVYGWVRMVLPERSIRRPTPSVEPATAGVGAERRRSPRGAPAPGA
jgi:MFS family permease